MHDTHRTISDGDRLADSLAIRISPVMRAELERFAIEQERSLGSVVRRALRMALEESS